MLLPIVLLFVFSGVHGTPVEKLKGESLLIILVDGVRWDYISAADAELKGFQRLAENGVTAEHVTPVFPSNSYPNWYSIVTGLFPESHGMVQNYMYDEHYNDYFLMSPHENVSHVHWWNQTEPLWITAQKAGIETKMVWWDGCQVKISDTNVAFCEPYKSIGNWSSVYNDTLDNILKILNEFSEKKYQLAMVYFEPVDSTGHKYGPNSSQRKEALKEIDKILDEIQDKVKELNLEDKLNLVIVSDHGMTETGEGKVKYINITSFVDLDDIDVMLGAGSLSMILPAKSSVKKLYNALVDKKITGLQVFLKEDIPEHYHFKRNHLVLPILLLADQGYSIQPINDETKMIPSYSSLSKGSHGYDPYKEMDMKTVFFARGPSLKKGYVASPINMVDHYNLFCHLLGLDCLPNNGSWAHVAGLMLSKSSTSVCSMWLLITAYSFVQYFAVCCKF